MLALGAILGMASHRNRKGRKRKAGPRSASGRLTNEDSEDRRVVVFNQPHRRHLLTRDADGRVVDRRRDQRAESVVGSLNLVGAITDREYAAARLYRTVVMRYWAVLGVPDATMQPVPGRGGEIPPAEALLRQRADERVRKALNHAGRAAVRCVNRVVLYGMELETGALAELRRGLQALAAHFGGGKVEAEA